MTSVDIDTRQRHLLPGECCSTNCSPGETPLGPKKLMESGLDAMCRSIREQEPVRPSTRLTQELSAAQIVAAGHSEPRGNCRPNRSARSIEGTDSPVARGPGSGWWMKMPGEGSHPAVRVGARAGRRRPSITSSTSRCRRTASLAYRTRKILAAHRQPIVTAGLFPCCSWACWPPLGLRPKCACAKAPWARKTALPGRQPVPTGRIFRRAFSLARPSRPKAVIPRDPVLADLWFASVRNTRSRRFPPAPRFLARLRPKRMNPGSTWAVALDPRTLPQGIYRWKIEKQGFQTHECVGNRSSRSACCPRTTNHGYGGGSVPSPPTPRRPGTDKPAEVPSLLDGQVRGEQ